MANEYKTVADFLTITIAEAHPMDGWRMFSYVDVNQHRNMVDRESCTVKYIQMSKTKATVVMDLTNDEIEKLNKNLDNGKIVCAETAYAAHPERFYAVRNGVVVYKGDIGPYGYIVKAQHANDNSLETFLKTLKK